MLLLAAATSTVQAEEGMRSVINGGLSCGKWTQTAKGSFQHEVFKGWVLGFVSGVNFGKAEGDFLRGRDPDGLTVWVDNYCRREPVARHNAGYAGACERARTAAGALADLFSTSLVVRVAAAPHGARQCVSGSAGELPEFMLVRVAASPRGCTGRDGGDKTGIALRINDCANLARSCIRNSYEPYPADRPLHRVPQGLRKEGHLDHGAAQARVGFGLDRWRGVADCAALPTLR
jgi:hypothetical protein